MNLTFKVNEVLLELERRNRALDEQALILAQTAERLSQDTAVTEAFRCGQQTKQDQIIAMIDLQLNQLEGAGINVLSLKTLRRHIIEGMQ
jgi:transcription initiation factor IIE alpha subunit